MTSLAVCSLVTSVDCKAKSPKRSDDQERGGVLDIDPLRFSMAKISDQLISEINRSIVMCNHGRSNRSVILIAIDGIKV